MNLDDIVGQIVRMQGLMPEVNRTTVAIRFQNMITDSMKTMFGDDDERTLKWVNEDAPRFLQACQLKSPRMPINFGVVADSSAIAKFVDKWESVNTWRLDDDDDWKPMSQETLNVKATMLRDLREIAYVRSDETTTPGEEPGVQQS